MRNQFTRHPVGAGAVGCSAPGFSTGVSRRRFIQAISTGAATTLGGFSLPALAAVPASVRPSLTTLTGTAFNLTVGYLPVNFTGRERQATAVNGSVPAPLLRWREGDTVTLNVTNQLAHDTSIHWHGLILPAAMDGVPGLSSGFGGIKPGETFQYQFKVQQNGTYWYHSHSGFQEQTGLYGPIVIDAREPEPFAYDRDYVVMLSDWSDENPDSVYANLKKLSHVYAAHERTVGDLWREVKARGVSATWQARAMWNQMRMSDRDLADVTGLTYTFLINGCTPAQGWEGLFRRGEKIRLRFINGSAMTFFDVRIPGLKMTVVAADGQYVEPVSVEEIRIGNAETYDVIVEPDSEQAYTIFAQAMDRSGYARGTLTPHAGLAGELPPMDPPGVLTHVDMGMDMGMTGGNHQISSSAVHDHSQMHHVQMSDANMGHPNMDHSQMSPAMMDHSAMGHMTMPTSGSQTSAAGLVMGAGPAGYGSSRAVIHAATEQGPHTDMLAMAPQYRLSDPGVGLRNNGRKVLTYADLRHLYKTPDPREPSREIDIHLTGNMARYMWSMNGVAFADADPVNLRLGERVRINLINDTMMNHPIHLHGLWSDLETGDPNHIPRKHTIVVQPGARISYLVSADAPGTWAYHCHLMYHMLSMFRAVVVS